jgi:hypothetical protein
MTSRPLLRAASACVAIAAMSAPAYAQNKTQNGIEKCEAPIGTISINEPEAAMVRALSGYNLGSPAGVLQVTDDLVYLGVEEGGYLKVLAPAGESWVRKLVVSK